MIKDQAPHDVSKRYGVLVLLGSTLGTAGSNALVHGAAILPPFQVLFLKAATAFFVVSVALCLRGGVLRPWRSAMKRWHFAKGVAALLGNLFWIIALQRLPLGECAALSLSSALFTALGGILWFHEAQSRGLWIALFAGFLGVYLIAKPVLWSSAWVFPLLSAFFFSLSSLVVKKVALRDSSDVTLFFLMGLLAGLSCVPALIQWAPMAWRDGACIAGAGILYAIVHLFLIEAYTYAPAVLLAPFKFARFPMNIFAGFVFFAEIPGWATLIGAGMTAGGMVCIWVTQGQPVCRGSTKMIQKSR